jgi:hypothetical protein
MHHGALLWGELLGKGRIEMSGMPILGGGRPVMLQGQTGMIYKQSPEEEAFGRWQRGEFLEVERGIAKQWRRELQALNLHEIKDSFKAIYEKGGKPNTLDLIKALADSLIDGPQQAAVLELLGTSGLRSRVSRPGSRSLGGGWLTSHSRIRSLFFVCYFGRSVLLSRDSSRADWQ